MGDAKSLYGFLFEDQPDTNINVESLYEILIELYDICSFKDTFNSKIELPSKYLNPFITDSRVIFNYEVEIVLASISSVYALHLMTKLGHIRGGRNIRLSNGESAREELEFHYNQYASAYDILVWIIETYG